MKRQVRLLSVLAATLLFAGPLAPANATPVAYMLSPDVTGQLAGGVTYTVSATFDWDSTTNLESAVDIVLAGPGSYAGTYTADAAFIAEVQSAVPDNQDICGTDGPDATCLRFDDVVGSVVPDPLFGVFTGDDPSNLNAPATGQIVGASAAAVLAATTSVPEASSVSLLAGGLLGFALTMLMIRRRKQNDGGLLQSSVS
jgi:hypothetical protein